MRVLFISHEPDVEPGYLGEAARRRGLAVDVCELWDDEPLPDAGAHDLIVPLGSAESAYDDAVPWLAGELALLRAAAAADIAVLGVCFGAQALARALGGSVGPATHPEVGWYTIDTTAPGLIAPGPWLEWHFDALVPPAGAVTLATSRSGVQAFQHGRQLGVQFHPEVTPAILAAWIASSGTRLERHGVDPDRLRDETARRVPHARAAAHALFDRVLRRLEVDVAHVRRPRTAALGSTGVD